MNPDGNNWKTLTSKKGFSHQPHFINAMLSPDKTKLVYQADTDRHDRYAIWIMNVDGSSKKRITQKEGMYPNWSPDGKTIIFSGRRNGVWEILTIPSIGGKETNISNNYSKTKKPGWGATTCYHPNGTSIVYTHIREKVLYSMDLSTKEIKQLSPNGHSYSRPIFSSNGEKIAVNRKIDNQYDLILLYIENNQINTVVENIISYSSPAWSYDNKKLLFTGMKNKNQELFMVNIESKKEKQLTNNAVFDALPTW